ncbi:MAG TPA: rod shape-determining protein MreD [Acidobacteriota bacterium]|nr:rod shape-determining protein MreD [Acidobacteriota bacterium]
MRIIRYALLLVAVFIFSSAFRWLFPQAPLPFDLFLIVVVFVALFRSPMHAQLFGLATGLIQDVFSNEIIGLNAVSLTILAYAIASLRQAVMIKAAPQRALAFTFATIADAFLLAGIASAFNLPVVLDPLSLMIRAIANTAIGLIAVLLLQNRIEERQKMERYEVA